MKSQLAGELQLAAHIDLACGIFACKHHGKAGLAVGSGDESGGALGHGFLDVGGQRYAIQMYCFGHFAHLFELGRVPAGSVKSFPSLCSMSAASPATLTDF